VPHQDASVPTNGRVADDSAEKILNTNKRRKGCTGSWKNGRNEGNERVRPDGRFIVGRTRDNVECMIECSVDNSERRRNALCDSVASVNGKNIRISRNIVSLGYK